MTAQILDVCKYVNKTYDIIVMEKELSFKPQQLGVEVDFHPSCWRGYYGEYSLVKKKLTLNNLHVYKKGECPIVKGKRAHVSQGMFNDFSLYNDLNILVDYTGGIIIGREFLPEYYENMGKQTPHTYKVLYELIFEQGEIVRTIDHSSNMALIREKYMGVLNEELKKKIIDDIQEVLTFNYKL